MRIKLIRNSDFALIMYSGIRNGKPVTKATILKGDKFLAGWGKGYSILYFNRNKLRKWYNLISFHKLILHEFLHILSPSVYVTRIIHKIQRKTLGILL